MRKRVVGLALLVALAVLCAAALSTAGPEARKAARESAYYPKRAYDNPYPCSGSVCF